MNIIDQAKELEKEFQQKREYWNKLGWFKIHHKEYVQRAYQDQYGIWHGAYVIDNEVEIHVTDTFVYESYNSTMLGAIAKDRDGNEYQYHPDAISIGNGNWCGNGYYNWSRDPFQLTIYKNGEVFKK